MQYVTLEDTVYLYFAANTTDGSANDGASAVYDVREGGASSSAAPTLSGSATLLTHANYSDGLYEVAIAATAANGFSANKTYAVLVTLAVDSQTPAAHIGSFRTAPVPAQLANGVAHGGSTATLRLGIDSATDPAFWVENLNDGPAVLFKANTTDNGTGLYIEGGSGGGYGLWVEGALGDIYCGGSGLIFGDLTGSVGTVNSLGVGSIVSTSFNGGAITAAALATNTITAASLAADAGAEIADAWSARNAAGGSNGGKTNAYYLQCGPPKIVMNAAGTLATIYGADGVTVIALDVPIDRLPLTVGGMRNITPP